MIIGAAASVATSRNYAELEASLEIPAVQLGEAHRVATYRLRATGTGMSRTDHGSVTILASTAQSVPVPFVLSARSSIDDQSTALSVTTYAGIGVSIDCDSLPCADDVIVTLTVGRRDDGTWPAPSEWTVSAELQILIGDRRDPPRGTSVALELVP